MTNSPEARTTAAGTELFKRAFRDHPGGVAIVTAASPSGPVGLTASSVASVSAEPPILAFSVSTESRSASVIAGADTVLVHLLGAGQVDLARTFAARGSARFTPDMDWETLPSGEPLLHGTRWVLRCDVVGRLPLGSSVLIAAQVVEVLPQNNDGAPLVYHDRTFHWLGLDSRLP